jgi:hypothetical protein
VSASDFNTQYINLQPDVRIGLPLKPQTLTDAFFDWPLLPDVFQASFPGVQSGRDELLIDIDKKKLVQRMTRYFDPRVTNDEMTKHSPVALEDTARFEAAKVREYLVNRGFLEENVIPHLYRPFDLRWLYWEPETKLLDEKRAEYLQHVFDGNIWLAAVQQNRKSFDPPVVSRRVGSRHVVERGANWFPLWLVHDEENHLFEKDHAPRIGEHQLNLSRTATDYLRTIGQIEVPEFLFYHVVAVLHASQYAVENAGAIRQDWPRIPLPSSKEALLHSAELGRKIAALLDTERGVAGVTEGKIEKPIDTVGVISRVDGGQLQTEEDEPSGKISELRITAGWGHGGKGGITMPGKGKVIERDYTPPERTAIEGSAERLGLSMEEMFAHLGEKTCDVHLNNVAYWRNIPARVWEYTIGGYQVIKKWLSYREHKLLGRPLTTDEAREVMNIARRVAAILLLEPELDANYLAVKASIYQWSSNHQEPS